MGKPEEIANITLIELYELGFIPEDRQKEARDIIATIIREETRELVRVSRNQLGNNEYLIDFAKIRKTADAWKNLDKAKNLLSQWEEE